MYAYTYIHIYISEANEKHEDIAFKTNEFWPHTGMRTNIHTNKFQIKNKSYHIHASVHHVQNDLF